MYNNTHSKTSNLIIIVTGTSDTTKHNPVIYDRIDTSGCVGTGALAVVLFNAQIKQVREPFVEQLPGLFCSFKFSFKLSSPYRPRSGWGRELVSSFASDDK